MLKQRRPVLASIVVTGLLMSPAGYAADAIFEADVQRVLVTADDAVGGCMALLSPDPASALPTCGQGWVTFSCSGVYTDNVRAYRMLDQAQLALATGSKVVVSITDNATHAGYCFVNRIDILR